MSASPVFVERMFSPASVPGYMQRLQILFATKLMARGFSSSILAQTDTEFAIEVSDYRGRSDIFLVKCIASTLIEWRIL